MIRTWKVRQIIEKEGEFAVLPSQTARLRKMKRLAEVGKFELIRTEGEILIYGMPKAKEPI